MQVRREQPPRAQGKMRGLNGKLSSLWISNPVKRFSRAPCNTTSANLKFLNASLIHDIGWNLRKDGIGDLLRLLVEFNSRAEKSPLTIPTRSPLEGANQEIYIRQGAIKLAPNN